MPSYMELEVKEIQPNYKAKLKDINVKEYGEKSSEAFENIVTWCLNGEVKKLTEASQIDLYRKILYSLGSKPCVDVLTEYNICEFASISGSVEVMKTLPKNYMGRSLIFAILKDDLEMVKYILSTKASYENTGVLSCICPAVQRGNLEVVKTLVENRKNWSKEYNGNVRYIDYRNALEIAVDKERMDLVKLLVNNNADPTSALRNAVANNNYEIVEFLVDNGACLFQIFRNKSFMKHVNHDNISVGGKEDEKIKDLLSSKMKIKQENIPLNHVARTSSHIKDDFTKLVTHCLNGNISKISGDKHGKYLKDNTHDWHTGYRPIDFAALQGNLELVKHLLSLGAMSEVRTSNYYLGFANSAIDVAVKKNQMQVAHYLFENCIKPEEQLFFAIGKGFLDLARHSLESASKPDISAYNKSGMTALHLASREGKLDFVQLLVNNGADVFQKDLKNRTALRLTKKECGDSETKQKIIEFLKSKMKSQEKSSDGKESNSPASTSKKRNLEESSDTSGARLSKEPNSKSKKTETLDNNLNIQTETQSGQSIKETSKESKNPEEIAIVVQPLLESFMKNDFSQKTKMICLSALEVIIGKDPSACDFVLKKEFFDEIGKIVEDIVSKESGDDEVNKDFEMIAKILAKLERRSSDGKTLVGGMKMSFSAFDRLRTQMKKFELTSNASDYVFDSDQRIKVKTEVTEILLE